MARTLIDKNLPCHSGVTVLGSWPVGALLRSAKTTHLCRPAQTGASVPFSYRTVAIYKMHSGYYVSNAYHIARSCAHSTCMYRCAVSKFAAGNAVMQTSSGAQSDVLVAKSICTNQSRIWPMNEGCLPAATHQIGSVV